MLDMIDTMLQSYCCTNIIQHCESFQNNEHYVRAISSWANEQLVTNKEIVVNEQLVINE